MFTTYLGGKFFVDCSTTVKVVIGSSMVHPKIKKIAIGVVRFLLCEAVSTPTERDAAPCSVSYIKSYQLSRQAQHQVVYR